MINITGSEGDRQIPLERLYTDDALKPLATSEKEIVTKVIVPAQPSLQGHAFLKFSLRGGMEFAALNVAVILNMDDEMLCQRAHITVGAVSASPLRIIKAEEALQRQRLSKDLLQQVAQIVASEAHPFPHHGYSARYLRECLRVQTLRALNLAFERVRSN